MYVLIGFDEDYYIFETFMGIFSTREKAQEVADNDYDLFDDVKIPNHAWYKIFEVPIDELYLIEYN